MRKWTCDTLKNYKIVSLAVYEINKDSEIYLGIATKNQNIVYLNMMKQFYTSNSAIKNDSYIGSINDDNDSSILPNDEIQFETVAKGFHSGPIICMDISI